MYWSSKIALDRVWPFYPQSPKEQPSGPDRPRWKNLYTSPVGRDGKRNLARIIRAFGHEHFDYLIFAFDDTPFNEPIFSCCEIIREKGILCYFFKKYVTPDRCQKYDYVFAWVDDLLVGRFSYRRFLEIFEQNHLDAAQPALSKMSLISHHLTSRTNARVGRLTDYIEVMAQVFTRDAWCRYWKMMEPDWAHWGWGYDSLLKSVCGLERLGIMDCETVTHQKKTSWRTHAKAEKERLFKKYSGHEQARLENLGSLI